MKWKDDCLGPFLLLRNNSVKKEIGDPRREEKKRTLRVRGLVVNEKNKKLREIQVDLKTINF